MGSKSRTDTFANGEQVRPLTDGALYETGPGGGVMVYVPLSTIDHADCQGAFGKIKSGLGDATNCSGDDLAPGFQKQLDANGWMAVAIAYADAATGSEQAKATEVAASLRTWANARKPEQILADARAEWDAWRKPPPSGVGLCTKDELKLWRQSEAVLRMGQVREPNTATRKNHGMVLASLPPGEWHTGWVRDAMYAVVALARSGHAEEAKAALEFFLNAEPAGRYKSYVGNQDYRISLTRYYGSGEEEADWSNSGPNIEIDGWGLFLWAARQYVDASGDSAWLGSTGRFGVVYDVINNGVAKALEANLEPSGIAKADSSIWEIHQPGKHYAYTTLAAIRGLCDMGALATRAAKPDAAHYAMLADKGKQGLSALFLDTNGAIAGNVEGLANNKYDDGSVAEAFTWNLVGDYTSRTAKATLDLFGRLKVGSGGFKRNNDGLSAYDSNEWILVDLRISDSLRRAGRGSEADGYLATIVGKASANFYLLPELYNAVASDGAIGKYAGSIPMVGYGGGAYLLTIIDRAGVTEPNDCGDGKGVTAMPFVCPGGNLDVDAGAGPSGPGGGGGGAGGVDGGVATIPYTPACLCDFAAAHAAGGTIALLLLPFLLLAWRLRRRAG